MSFERHEPDYVSALGSDDHQHFSGDLHRILREGERDFRRNDRGLFPLGATDERASDILWPI